MTHRSTLTAVIADTQIVVVTADQLMGIVRGAIEAAVAELRQDASPTLLDRSAIARQLGVGTSTLDRLRREGLPCILIGDSPRFEVASCIEWLRQHHARSASELAADAAGVPTE